MITPERLSKGISCRSEGKLYVLVKHEGELRARKGANLPVKVMPFGHGSASDGKSRSTPTAAQEWVVSSPYFDDVKRNLLELEDASGAPVEVLVSYGAIKWESRFNWRARRSLCEHMVEAANAFDPAALSVKFLRYLPKDDHVVWRICVESVQGSDPNVALSVKDAHHADVDFDLYFFEAQDVILENGTEVKRTFYSLELPASLKCFYLEARDKTGRLASGFASVDVRLYNGMENITWNWMKCASDDEKNYRCWYEQHRASEKELEEQARASFSNMPLFSIVVPCFDSQEGFLNECIESVTAQSYSNWELLLVDGSVSDSGIVKKAANRFDDDRIRYIPLSENLGIVGNTNAGIEEARGDWVAFLDHDDKLAADALFCYAQAIDEDADISALFCDEDSFTANDDFRWPSFKSTLNQDLLYAHNCVTHFLAVRKSMLDAIGPSQEDVAGAQDYDLTLRVLAAGGSIHHIPRVLYHWRMHEDSTAGDNIESKPYAQTAGRIALQRHFDQRGIAGRVEETAHPFVYRMRYTIPEPLPLVSVVIPTKDHIEELDACIRSIMDRSDYREFEIVVVENNSEDAETFAYYERIQRECSQVHVVFWDGPFNYSAIINYGVDHSNGEMLLLLNNDTEVISPDFMTEMLGYLVRPEVGVVGAKLYFRDGLTQHAGIEVGPFDAIVHVNQDFSSNREGYGGRAVRPGNFSAVTGACQMVRCDVFEEVGGYDEAFAVGFNDADFCMRAYEAGYLTVFTPYAEFYHYEFTSRGREEADPMKQQRWERERALFQKRWSSYFTVGDPFSNPNLSLESSYYALPEVPH